MQNTVRRSEQAVDHVGIVFHAKLEVFHDVVDLNVVGPPIAAQLTWRLDVVLLILLKSLVLPTKPLKFPPKDVEIRCFLVECTNRRHPCRWCLTKRHKRRTP